MSDYLGNMLEMQRQQTADVLSERLVELQRRTNAIIIVLAATFLIVVIALKNKKG